MAISSVSCVATEPVSQNRCLSPDKNYELIAKVQPKYPHGAYHSNTNGWVALRFDVSESGATEKIEVLEGQPEGTFDTVAIQAIKQFKFSPRILSCAPVRVEGVEYKLTFERT